VAHGERPDSSRRGEEPFDTLAAQMAALDVPGSDDVHDTPRDVSPSLWNLDILDDRGAGRDGAFRPSLPTAGAGVTIYHLDTGVTTTHREFGGRAAVAADLTGGDGRDANGHGTHTAGTAVGALVGVAPGATLVSYRVLDGQGGGRVSALVAALDAIVATRRRQAEQGPPPPAVALMSLGTPARQAGPEHVANADAVEAAVRALVATNVTVVAAAGNGGPGEDACATLPAALGGDPDSGVLAVAAADLADKFEVGDRGRRSTPPYPFSSTGRCVSVWAPGVDVLGACGATPRCASPDDGRSYAWASGSSMAAPHVAGAAALLLSAAPALAPAEVAAWVRRSATAGAVGRGRLVLPGTPDGLLFLGAE
jgi:subtilisin family serine protease